MITVQCPTCQATFSASEQHAGRKGKCKHCGTIVTIPHASPAAVPQPPRGPAAYRAAPPQPTYQQPAYPPQAPAYPPQAPAYPQQAYAAPEQQYSQDYAAQDYAAQGYDPSAYAQPATGYAPQYQQPVQPQQQQQSAAYWQQADPSAWQQQAPVQQWPAQQGWEQQPTTSATRPKKKKGGIPPIVWIGGGVAVVALIAFIAYRAGSGTSTPPSATNTPVTKTPASEVKPVVEKPTPPPVPVTPPPAPTPPADARPSATSKDLTAEEIVSRFGPSVVLIKSEFGSGTGFYIAPRLVCTNYHVIAGSPSSELEIHYPSLRLFVGFDTVESIIFADPARDLAFLRLKPSRATPPELVLAESYVFRGGQPVTVIGSPGAGGGKILENAVTPGMMSTQTEVRGQPYYQLSAAINPGNSGGPVFDIKGRVVGVVTLKATFKEGIGYCIPVESVISNFNRSKSVSDDDADVLTMRHDVASIRHTVSEVSDYVFSRADAIAANARMKSAAGKALEDLVEEVDRRAIARLKVAADRIRSDSRTPDDLKKHLGDVWDTWESLRGHCTAKKFTELSFRRDLKNLYEKHEKAVEAMGKALGDMAGDEREE